MFLSNSGFLKEIFQQTGAFSMSGDFTLLDINTIFEFGVSGSSGTNSKTAIKFSGSKFFDSNNRMIGSYVAGEPLRGLLSTTPTHYSFYFNGQPVIYGQPRDNTGYVEYFFAASYTGQTSFSYQVKGDLPNFSVTNFIPFVNDPTSLTGWFYNNSHANIKIYTGELLNDDYFSVNFTTGDIGTGASGAIVFTPNVTGLGGVYPIPFNLYTNFGIVKTGTTLSGYQEINNGYLMDVVGRSIVDFDTSENYFIKISSFSGDLSGVVYLQHVSGSGMVRELTNYSGYSTGLATGAISESGFLTFTQNISGTGQGGIYGSESGIFTGNVSIFKWATGLVSSTISVQATGYGTGVGYSGLATGFINIPVSGIVLDGSGSLLITGLITGNPTSSYNLYPWFTQEATGAIYYNTPENAVTSDIIYINTIYHGIVYGFHHNNISGLAAYLNANTGIHRVRASVSGANTVLLSGIGGADGNNILLIADQDNDGDMAVSGPYLAGGITSGFDLPVTNIGGFTGYANTTAIKTGLYQQNYSGLLSGSGYITTFFRSFSGIWNLHTGLVSNNMVNFQENNYYTNNRYINSVAYDGNLYAIVSYNDYNSSTTDIARLYVSGVNNGSGVFDYIEITGQL
jgi:hypothetical protein